MDQALEQRHGLAITSSDVDGLRQRFYRVRKEMRDLGFDEYDQLLFTISPRDRSRLLIVNRDKDVERNDPHTRHQEADA